MLTLFCALVGQKGSAFSIKIDASESVDALKKVIKKEKENDLKAIDADKLQLFLAKKDNEWLKSSSEDVTTLKEGGKTDQIGVLTKTINELQGEFGLDEVLEGMPVPSTKEIHVLVVVPEVDQVQWGDSWTTIEVEKMDSIEATLDIDEWQIGGIELDIHQIEPDFPKWFYVRKETKDIFNIFLGNDPNTVLLGSPGVGKSMLVVLFAFYVALRQQKVVVLFRKLKGKGFSLLYMDRKNKKYWRNDQAELHDLSGMRKRDLVLFLDGFLQTDINNIQNFGKLASFRLLATSAQYDWKNDETVTHSLCLVPFWSKSDLNKIGNHKCWAESNINERYYYSGGNLRDFLSGKALAMKAINNATNLVRIETPELLSTQYGRTSVDQIDRFRMTTIESHGQPVNLETYSDCAHWLCVITSEYVLRKLGEIVKPSYYEILWSKGCLLGDDALMGVAFENYVHAMARDKQVLELQMRLYDRKKTPKKHKYSMLEFQSTSCRNSGNDTAECETIMQQLANADVDYWYPCSRSLETIDCVAKLNMVGKHKEVGLIQITKSDSHKIDSEALTRYAEMFPNKKRRYIVLVPNKETSDKFRLSPADPPTKVPLHVAYVTNQNFMVQHEAFFNNTLS